MKREIPVPRRPLCFLALFLVSCSAVRSVPADRAVDLSTQLDALLAGHQAENRFMGSVLVAVGGEVILRKSYGTGDLGEEIPNRPETMHRIDSVTKPFTALAILLLEEDGRLRLDDPVSRHVEGVPEEIAERITIHHLLSHTSGLPDYIHLPEAAPYYEQEVPLGTLLDLFRSRPLDFEPGEGFKYSNSGYLLLGAIVEAVSGQPYEAFLRDRVFAPLGMDRTGMGDWFDLSTKVRSRGYERGKPAASGDTGAPRPLVPTIRVVPRFLHAAGGLFSTVDDLYRWDRALRANELLGAESRDRMFEPHGSGEAFAEQVSYGYGWFVGRESDRRAVWHIGGAPGYGALVMRFPEDDVCIVVLNNVGVGFSAMHDLARKISDLVFSGRN